MKASRRQLAGTYTLPASIAATPIKERLLWALKKGQDGDLGQVQRHVLSIYCLNPAPNFVDVATNTGLSDETVSKKAKGLSVLGLLDWTPNRIFKCVDCRGPRDRNAKSRCLPCFSKKEARDRNMAPRLYNVPCLDCGKNVRESRVDRPRCRPCWLKWRREGWGKTTSSSHPWAKQNQIAYQAWVTLKLRAPCPHCSALAHFPCTEKSGAEATPHAARGKG